MVWYTEWFGQRYLELYAHRDRNEATRQVGLLTGLVTPTPGMRSLDVACGAGRHVVELARRNFNPVGLDLSWPLLRVAQLEVKESGMDVPLIRSDMRYLPFISSSFDLVTSFFTSFGYFQNDNEHQELLIEWRRVLRRGGVLFLDYLNCDYVLANLERESSRVLKKHDVHEKRAISPDGTRINKEITIIDRDAGTEEKFKESVRMYGLDELKKMFEVAGFHIKTVFGNFEGKPFSPTSERLILVGEINEGG